MPAMESTATVTARLRASAATRAHLSGLTISFAISTSSQKSATTSASDTVAHVSPTQDPAANCRRAMAGVLCALKCGRSRHGPLAKNAAMRAMLRSSAATSTISAGVGISERVVTIVDSSIFDC
jgi:hypothetical protein